MKTVLVVQMSEQALEDGRHKFIITELSEYNPLKLNKLNKFILYSNPQDFKSIQNCITDLLVYLYCPEERLL